MYLEVTLDAIGGERHPVRQRLAPAFPCRHARLSFWIDVSVTADDQRALLASTAGPLLRELAVLEDYRDPRYAPAGKKGMLWTPDLPGRRSDPHRRRGRRRPRPHRRRR